MTDVSKYKSVALLHDSCDKLDKIRKVIVPEVEVSRPKSLDILINAYARKLSCRLRNKKFTFTRGIHIKHKRPRYYYQRVSKKTKWQTTKKLLMSLIHLIQ